MGNSLSGEKDFHWEYTEAPHASRRVEMLRKYPEIKALMKPDGDPPMIFVGIILVIIQYSLAYINYYYISCLPLRFLLNCTLGTWIASAIFMHMHEAGHGTICGPNHLWKNRAYGSLMNFGLGLPLYAYFKKHHKVHHKYQGEVNLDVEYPYEFELKYFTGPFGKYCWMVLNPEIQAIRSCMDKWSLNYFTTGISIEEKLGLVSIVTFNVWLAFSGRFYIMSHLILSTFAAMGGHVLGFWNIAVHVEFFRTQETSTYCGWLNFFMTNFGLHMEHHDFPSIPSRLLPKVRKIAPEFYDEDYSFDSLHSCVVKFIFDSKYGVYSRVKRDTKPENAE